MRALREERRQHHQIRQGTTATGPRRAVARFRGPHDESQMASLAEVVDVIDANPGETCHFRIGEDFLARFDGNHCLAPGPHSLASSIPTDNQHDYWMLVAD